MARTRRGQGETLSGSPVGQFTNFAQKPIQSLRAPTIADTGYEIGQLWTDTSEGLIYGLTQVLAGKASWKVMTLFDGDEITRFTESPIMQSSSTTGGPPSGASEFTNLMSLQQGIIMEQFMIGIQGIIAPRMSNDGLEVALDQTASQGVEYNFGNGRFANQHIFEVGLDSAAFFEVKFSIEDMSGAGPFLIGYRIRENSQLDINDYPDYVTIGMDAAVSATNIVIVDQVFPGIQDTTDTTDLWGGDGRDNTLRASINTDGSVTFTINGNTPTVTKSYKFVNGLLVVPFMRFIQNADFSEVTLLSMKVGSQF